LNLRAGCAKDSVVSPQAGKSIFSDSLARFRVDSHDAVFELHQEVDLDALAVPVKRKGGLKPTVRPRLQNLRCHPGLEDGAAKGVLTELLRRPDAEEVAHPSRESGAWAF